MQKTKIIILCILVLLNCVVLLGQLWPEGAPPFAGKVNVLFLIGSLVYFISELVKRKKL